ncbi:succinate--CoA ligase subunit alpha [Calderihabitans maritimus]|uniref:Succinate--CoA ligase n=1 Tax=Calderihabitans maritimus TaxID=1246530 RepID=A0A1Z5HTD8_9FIRM|nr:CoA-binding protein [Calderihabitans maritimus]GAW92806.1 Succinate--CoA ligase [Calderihabitans maritimus]
MAILLDRNCKIVVQGITGREASMVTKHTLDYGTPIVAGVTPGKGGQEVHGVPVYDTLRQACREHEINTAMVYVPPAFVLSAVMEAIDNGIKFIFIATENVPQHDVIKFLHIAREEGVRIVGPNSVGIISPGERMKLGAIGGDNPERCFVPGHVGVISRSGGMTAETAWMVKRAGYGVSTCVSIGGDALIGSPPKDLLALFEQDTDTQAVVTFSEPGTNFEEEMADFVREGGFTKPLISFVAGKFTETLPEGTVFGHAGAMIAGGMGKPSHKIEKLRDAGVHVADKFDDIITLLRQIL